MRQPWRGTTGRGECPSSPLNFFIAKLMRLITALSGEKAHVQIIIVLKNGEPVQVHVNRSFQPTTCLRSDRICWSARSRCRLIRCFTGITSLTA